MAANLYQAPRANVDMGEGAFEFQPVKIMSTDGRIGRVRYIGYSVGISVAIMFFAGIAIGIFGRAVPIAGTAIMGVAYIAVVIIHFALTIQRAHDFNVTGWVSVLSLVPLGILIFWLAPGTKGENRWGFETPPNGWGATLLALLLPLMVIVGIVAAVALPAYQDYVKRAHQVYPH